MGRPADATASMSDAPTTPSPLELALDREGLTQAELASLTELTPQAVHNWTVRGVPAERCADIERVTAGRITRFELRPDLFGKLPKHAANRRVERMRA